MSGEAGAGRSGGARRWVWIGGIVGAVVVSGALVAVVNERGDGDAADGSPSASETADAGPEPQEASVVDARTEWRHEFPSEYSGPVWITVESGDDSMVHSITIVWGAWTRQVVHEGTGPTSYEFSKGDGPSVPLTVRVEPAAAVTFGSGTPPSGAEDINADWTRGAVE